MNKIDLIIDALESAYEDKAGWCDKVNEALYAARELKALKPVLWKHSGDGWSYEKPLFPATPLYALEVTK
jgi:hypothetical protein